MPGHASIFTFPKDMKKIHEIHTKDTKEILTFLFLFFLYKCRGLIIKSLYVRFALEVT